jgi:hypothetical protein
MIAAERAKNNARPPATVTGQVAAAWDLLNQTHIHWLQRFPDACRVVADVCWRDARWGNQSCWQSRRLD